MTRLAIVQGLGYPQPNLSHFRSIEIWDTGSKSDEYLDAVIKESLRLRPVVPAVGRMLAAVDRLLADKRRYARKKPGNRLRSCSFEVNPRRAPTPVGTSFHCHVASSVR